METVDYLWRCEGVELTEWVFAETYKAGVQDLARQQNGGKTVSSQGIDTAIRTGPDGPTAVLKNGRRAITGIVPDVCVADVADAYLLRLAETTGMQELTTLRRKAVCDQLQGEIAQR